MKRTTISTIIVCMTLFLHFSCINEQSPTHLIPEVAIHSARNITRNSATLSGSIEIVADGDVSVVKFRYGTTTEMTNYVDCSTALVNPTTRIQNLSPNTTYYYCLEVGNELQTIRSEIGEFTTMPNVKPQLSPLKMISQGPLSITLQITIDDNGGQELTDIGFYYTEVSGNEQKIQISTIDKPVYTYRIGDLALETSYTIQAYAKNSIGESRSESYTFQTKQAIALTQAGTLPDAIDEKEKYSFKELSISGPLNGTDVRFIREMLGRDVQGNETEGKLAFLDLSDASIREGGLSYNYSRYTKNDQITHELFADCIYLTELHLPHDVTIVEENAFKNCSSLETIHISVNTSQIYSSVGCSNLTNFQVYTNNPYLKSTDGVLYDKALTTLFWMPEWKTTVIDLPASLTTIKEYAFRNSKLSIIELPNGITECGMAAFYGASIEQMKLPDSLNNISDALFQHCRNLKIITLGKNVEQLGEYCFDGCPLEELHVQTPDFPPVCKPNTFAGLEEYVTTCTLYVPKGEMKRYQDNDYWEIFELIVEE